MSGPIDPRPSQGSTPSPGEAGDDAPRRRLEHAPGERFTGGERAGSGSDAPDEGSPGRGVLMGIVGGAVGVAIFLVLAIGFSFTAGLLVVAIFTGRFIGLFIRAGAGSTMSSAARVATAVVIFLFAMVVAMAATWLWSRVEGGDLALVDYLDQVYGTPLIALEFMLGTQLTWWSAR